jgi:hypothetical protein
MHAGAGICSIAAKPMAPWGASDFKGGQNSEQRVPKKAAGPLDTEKHLRTWRIRGKAVYGILFFSDA